MAIFNLKLVVVWDLLALGVDKQAKFEWSLSQSYGSQFLNAWRRDQREKDAHQATSILPFVKHLARRARQLEPF